MCGEGEHLLTASHELEHLLTASHELEHLMTASHELAALYLMGMSRPAVPQPKAKRRRVRDERQQMLNKLAQIR